MSKEPLLDDEPKTNEVETFLRNWQMKTYHLEQQILGNVEDRVRTQSTFKDQAQITMLLEVGPKNILTKQEELDQFQKNDIWKLVSPPNDKSIIGTKWIFRNKLDKNGKVVCNKARLVTQGYSQHEGINFTKTFALVARL
ncbi:putative mitochondrial protein, partial [Mucuna pruriens]